MEISDRCFVVSWGDGELVLRRAGRHGVLRLRWPAVRISVAGRIVAASRPAAPPRLFARRVSQEFAAGDMRFTVAIELIGSSWIRKSLAVTTDRALPTPDWVEVDRQLVADDGVRPRGYLARARADRGRGGEEGEGGMPGCGYPLIGRRLFAGLEHPAAFNLVRSSGGNQELRLRHFPIWHDGELERVDAVLGWSDDALSSFADYLDTIRLPPLRKPFVTFGTFWSDPYLGNREYRAERASYEAFIKAFASRGLVPDAFTLDAGWSDRRSFLRAKPEVGGDQGLVRLRRLAERMGSGLSLWVSHNGPLAMAPEFLASKGIAVGGGVSSAYCGDGFGVLMDAGLESALTERLGELVGTVGARHLKMDWDNECATSAAFRDTYPTRDHVRQASLNVLFRIARRLRELDKRVILRNGWWPSPWWLSEVNHVFLPDSGDSEYASLPSRTQRDGATTHRDLMYHAVLRRDGSVLPLDCIDNHEIPDALRNPFGDDPATFTNAVWLSFLRGSTYVAHTVMPDALDERKAAILADIMRFCRGNARHLYGGRGRMILGSPGRGEVYGFLHPGKTESWVVLRNPLPMPQELRFDAARIAGHPVATVRQLYPFHASLASRGSVTMLAHEIRIVILESRRSSMRPGEHMIEPAGKGCTYRVPASERPDVHPLQRVEGVRCLESSSQVLPGLSRVSWFVKTPYRMRETEVQLRLSGRGAGQVSLRAWSSRYRAGLSYAIPVVSVPSGNPGYGEKKNPVERGEEERFCAFRVPSGGEVSLTLELEGPPGVKLEAWLAGYEAPSSRGERGSAPARFRGCLPCQHPLGFGRAMPLPVGRLSR